MKIIQPIVLVLFYLSSFATINAQIGDSVLIEGKSKVFYFNNTNSAPLIVKDINNPSNILLSSPKVVNGFCTIYKVDDDLNVLDTIITQYKLPIKFNNKYYELFLHDYINTPQGSFTDTIYLFCADLTENKFVKKVISTFKDDSIKCPLFQAKAIFTKDNNIALFRTDYSIDSITNSNILLIDTLANIINSKTIRHQNPGSLADLAENNDYFELFISDNQKHTMYSLNKKTLDILDSISDFDSLSGISNFKFINDSIFITISGRGTEIDNIDKEEIRIVNKYTKNTKAINTPIYAYNGLNKMYNHPAFSNKIDYINTDSVYFVTYYSSIYNIWPENFFVTIQNFNINGTMNFQYELDFDTINYKEIYDIKATKDGGVIVACLNQDIHASCFIKFMPDGFVSITNIETNEKASLKVYPNPARDFINVDIEADRFNSSEIELFDIQGRMVKKSKLNAQIGNRIDVSLLPSGAYTYRVVINGKGINGKVIIGE